MTLDKSAIYHRTDSEYAYLYNETTVHIRLRTKKDNVDAVEVVYGDPYWTAHPKYTFYASMTKIVSTAHHDYWQAEIMPPFRRLQYAFKIRCDNEVSVYSELGFIEEASPLLLESNTYFKMPYTHISDCFKAPEWVPGTVWYQIFPERFANGSPKLSPPNVKPWDSIVKPKNSDFFGGDLQGILDKLDYLQSLGVNGLYLCPIFEAATNHKYDTIDYYAIDKHFGDKALFKRLVDEAHARGIRIMLDAVFNHIGYYSPQWQDVVQNGAQSRYKDWFHIHHFPVERQSIKEMERTGKLYYEMFAFASNLPKLNTSHPEVKRYLLDIATYWIREFDIDGWRLDVANEVDHQFWKSFHQEVTHIKSDFYILGEIWHTSQSWLNGDEFHGVMNYAFTQHIKHFFLQKKTSTTAFIERITAHQMLYRRQTNEVMFNLLDSHDTARVLTVANGDKNCVKTALMFMFLQIGTPCIYYGTEFGLQGNHDPDCRRVMPWNEDEQDLEMYEFTRKIVQFRRAEWELLTKGTAEYEVINVSPQCFQMTITHNNRSCKAWFNNGDSTFTLSTRVEDYILSNNYYNGELQPNGFVITMVE